MFYNYSEHGNSSVSFVEIVVPVSFEETHSKYNDFDYSEANLVKGAEIITSDDTISLKYTPLRLREQFFSLSKKDTERKEYTSYILQLGEPYKWGSLFQIDSLLSPLISKENEVRYLDTSGVYQSLHNVKLKPVYFFNGKQVTKDSKEFFQKMNIERPPLINAE